MNWRFWKRRERKEVEIVRKIRRNVITFYKGKPVVPDDIAGEFTTFILKFDREMNTADVACMINYYFSFVKEGKDTRTKVLPTGFLLSPVKSCDDKEELENMIEFILFDLK